MNKSRRSSGRVYTRLVCLDCSLDRMARPARAPRPRGKKSMSREKSNTESITKVTADEPQPTKKLGYTALMIKEEDFEGLAEDGHSKHLPVSQKLTLLEEPEVDIYSVVANEKNLGDGGPDSESQGTYEELLLRHEHHAGSITRKDKDGDCAEEDGAIEMNLQLSDQVHVNDGCSKEDGGKEIHASQLGEVNYLTLTGYVKEEPLDSDSMEGVLNGANWGMIKPQPLGEEGVRQPLLPVISDSRVQQLDDNLSSQAERGTPLDSSESDSSTSKCGPCNYANDSGKKQSVAERETLDQGLSHHVYGQMDTERTKECDEKCEETLIEGIGQSSQFGGTEENLAKPLFTLVAGEPYISQCRIL
ncbi:uncharacterized protein LOC105445315 isoform X2 [Strongylocentrotus purpuratus]|uniref:Uncharacterized protein n=1 Tax=Strongylocentrotus purpuratus TaxID=7668 RepID=A0A7M7HLP0_STRPU|nr:uncharacterized protein LOC105445315 isoform X2 [Strongylocentrotus purpuratus]